MRTETLHESGYIALFTNHIAGYLAHEFATFYDGRIQNSPAVVQAIIRENNKWLKKLYQQVTEETYKDKNAITQKVFEYEGIHRGYGWVEKHASEIVNYSRTLKRGIKPFIKDVVSGSHDKKIPTMISDFCYLTAYDILPVTLSVASSAILSRAVTSEIATDNFNANFLNLVWFMISAALYMEFVLPYSIRFLAHTIVMGVFYRKEFDEATKQDRKIDSKCCDDKCTTLRKAKGELRDVVGYILQTFFLLSTQLLWNTLGKNRLDIFVQPMLFFLNAFHFGQSTLVMRYASDGVCQRERFESVNHYVKFAAMLGLLQMGGVWIMQQSVVPMQYVPSFMLVNLFYLAALGVVHYIDVPKPTRVTFKSSLLKLIPTNAVYAAVGDDIDRAIDAFKEGCMTPINIQASKEWKSWRDFQAEIYQFFYNSYNKKLNWPTQKLLALIVNCAFPALLPSLKNEEAFLADPIFKKYWPDLFVEIDNVLEAIIIYREHAVRVAELISKINAVKETVKNTPGLPMILSVGSTIFLGPVKDLFTPQTFIQNTEDGLDTVLGTMNKLCEVLHMESDSLTMIQDARDAIKAFRKKRELLFKVLDTVGPASKLIAHHLDDEKFLKDVMNIRFYINNIMKNHHVGKFKNTDVYFSDLLIENEDGFFEVGREDKERVQLMDEFSDDRIKRILKRCFYDRDNIIAEENRARSKLEYKRNQGEIELEGRDAFAFPDSPNDNEPAKPSAQPDVAEFDDRNHNNHSGDETRHVGRFFRAEPKNLVASKDSLDDDFYEIDEQVVSVARAERQMPQKRSAFSLQFGGGQ